MKMCRLCGEEISTRDGENYCPTCEDIMDRKDKLAKRKRNLARAKRRARADVMKSCGLTRVRGALGGTYWE